MSQLKAFVRIDGNLRVVPSSLILRKKKPKIGKWREINSSLCCNDISVSGEWFFLDAYEPPFTQGLLDFPDHLNMESSLNPNLVGQTGGSTLVQLYINIYNSDNQLQNSLQYLPGNSGTLTLTQGANSVTYSFTSQAFAIDSEFFTNIVYYDNTFGDSPVDSISVISPSVGNFDTFLPILISVTFN